MKTRFIYSKRFTLLITLLLVVLTFRGYSQQYLPLTGGTLTGNLNLSSGAQFQGSFYGFDANITQPSSAYYTSIFANGSRGTIDFVGFTNGWRFIPNNASVYPSPVATIDPSGDAYFAKSLTLGTTTLPPGYTFAVNGNAIATSFTVQSYANWPDYVFSSDYKLPPLNLVKTYIDQNHHLPDVPSAEQIVKNGLNLGDINKITMQKVEELTLYLIEKDRQLNDEKEINLKQQNEIDSQKEQLDIAASQLKAQQNQIDSQKNVNIQLSQQLKFQQDQLDVLMKQVANLSDGK